MIGSHDPIPHVLVADVNGAQARIGVAERGRAPREVMVADCTSQDALIELLARARAGFDGPVLGVAVAAPGPNLNGVIKLTHSDMRLEAETMAERLGVHRLHLVNNFTARALAVPLLEPEALEAIGGGARIATRRSARSVRPRPALACPFSIPTASSDGPRRRRKAGTWIWPPATTAKPR
ncbi:glucokinase [Caulobacter sp. RL271]|uniref:Glucokinase n=1 Tax=Caulobacter segnis TaxID=88688 RepID=A0ABY4ZRI1_9CAUL|nr:glucokinase [Caulobacter segnis]USQ95311.1 glucokinase [Caulobacter segnis]